MSFAKRLALAVLTVGFGATAACSSELARPTPPSPGLLVRGGSSAPVLASPTPEGHGLGAPGIRLSARPKADGSFDITEEVVLRNATVRLPLRLPQSGQRLQGMMTPTTPKATGLRIVGDGLPVPLDQPDLNRSRVLQLFTAATKFTVTYRLEDSSVRRQRSRPGRASTAIRPLTAGVDGSLPTDLIVVGGGLLNAVCPQLKETRCAVGQVPRLAIQPGIPAAKTLVVLQLDLPIQP
jgi:hypothetical protein